MSSMLNTSLLQTTKDSKKNSCLNSNWPKTKQFLIKNFLTVGLLLALFIGLTYPLPGHIIASQQIQGYNVVKTLNICTIFLISGLTLRSSEIKAAFSAYCALVYSLILILLVTPFAGMLVLKIPYDPLEFAIGLAVFCAVPTTLTSGATLAMQANGNYALALMITVTSNILGVITVPFILKFILEGVVQGLQIKAFQLLKSLLLTILLPLIIGKLLRHCNKKIMKFGKNRKTGLSLINNGSLVMIVWQTISESQQTIMNSDIVSILLLVVSGIVLHFVFFGFNYLVVKIVRWEKETQRAVVLIASQKTLPVAVTIISYFGAGIGNKGLITLPCILAYLAQLFIDSFIVSRWLANDAKNDLKNNDKFINRTVNDSNFQYSVFDLQIQTDNYESKNNVQEQNLDLVEPFLSSNLDNNGGSSSSIVMTAYE